VDGSGGTSSSVEISSDSTDGNGVRRCWAAIIWRQRSGSFVVSIAIFGRFFSLWVSRFFCRNKWRVETNRDASICAGKGGARSRKALDRQRQ
jgi:hypothetical protein